MDSNRKNGNIQLGVFVALGTVLLIGALFYMGQQRSMFGQTVPLHLVMNDVRGLQAGNNVQYMGMTVGTVRRIAIVSSTDIQVDLAINKSIAPYIKSDASAQIGTEGLMGNKVVIISGGSEAANPVLAGSQLQPRPVLAVDSLLHTLQASSGHIQTLTENLAHISTQMRTSHTLINSLLTDTVVFDQLRHTMHNLHATSAQTSAMTADLSDMLRGVKTGRGTLGVLLNDSVSANDLKEAIHHIRLASEQSAQVATQLNTVSRHLSEGEGMAQTLLTDTAFMQQVEESLAEIRQGSERFNENMEALQHNFLFRGYFRRKARQAAVAAPVAGSQRPE
jgi:phospholipid/cholesterol/gamma-HCH transport system substrate-binding protein